MKSDLNRAAMIERRMLGCIHFNGIQNKACSAGVAYGDRGRIPCIPQHLNGTLPSWTCDLFRVRTREEAEAEFEESNRLIEKTLKAMRAAKADAKEAGAIAEGIARPDWFTDPRRSYRSLWHSLHGKTHPRESNPEVVRLAFEVVKP